MTLWILSVGCCLLHATPDNGNAGALCVMTYNIHHGEGRDGKLDLDRIASVIHEANPDIVCLQEIDRNLPRTNKLDFPAELAKRLGMPATFGCNFRFDGGEYGNATLTRFEILSQENIALPNPDPKNVEPRGCLKTVLQTPAGPIEVFNAHLGLNGHERKTQAQAILQHAGKAPAILAGDFNENVKSPGVTLLLTRFKDALSEGGVPAAQGLRARIDHIFVSRKIDVLSSRMLTSPQAAVASDHPGYVTQLQRHLQDGAAEKEGIYDTDADDAEALREAGVTETLTEGK